MGKFIMDGDLEGDGDEDFEEEGFFWWFLQKNIILALIPIIIIYQQWDGERTQIH